MARPARPRARRFTSVAIALVGMTVIAAGPMTVSAFAHSDLIATLPSNSARLDRPPAKVSFAFDSPLLQGTATITVLGSHNNLLESQKVTPDGESISMAWPAELHTGAYQVRYRGVSGDGHPVAGAINFTIEGSASAKVSPSMVIAPEQGALVAAGVSAMATQSSTASVFTAVLMSLGFLILAAMAGGLSRVRREREYEDPYGRQD